MINYLNLFCFYGLGLPSHLMFINFFTVFCNQFKGNLYIIVIILVATRAIQVQFIAIDSTPPCAI